MTAVRLTKGKLGGLVRAGLFAWLMALAPLAQAQDEDAAGSRSATFQAAEGARTEDVPGGSLLIGAYGVVWLLVLGYVISLGVRQAHTARAVERLRQDIEAAGKER